MRFAEIGQQLRAYRLESGLRAEEIAARLGVSRAALYRYEKGEVIKLDTVKRLAELLKVSPLSLLGIGVEYYSRSVGYFERIRQVEESADQVLQAYGAGLYLTTSEAFDAAMADGLNEAANLPGTDTAAFPHQCRPGARHPVRTQAHLCTAPARHHRDPLASVDPELPCAGPARQPETIRAAAGALPPRRRRRGAKHRRPNGDGADGAAVRPAGHGRNLERVQHLPLARPRNPGGEPVPGR